MKRFLILSIVLLVSCAPKEFHSTLDVLESRIEQAPDSVLSVVELIAPSKFASRKLKARHALLHTIALDKNYIDLKTDSIIAPAVKYYSRRGTANERFKTLYYHGRIFQNAGDTESALDCFIKASDLASEDVDSLALARCYAAQGVIYFEFYDFENSVKVSSDAAFLFKTLGNINSYANNLVKIADSYLSLGCPEVSWKYLKIVESYVSQLQPEVLSAYYSVSLRSTIGNNKNCTSLLEEYIGNVHESLINWNIISKAYIYMNQYNMAEDALLKYRLYDQNYNDMTYYAIRSELYELQGVYQEATQAYKKYLSVSDSIYIETHLQNLKNIEEDHIKDMAILRERNKNLLLILILLITGSLLFITILSVRKYLNERNSFKQTCLMAIQERDALSKIIENSLINDPEVNEILLERMTLLNEIVLNRRLPRTNSFHSTEQKMESLLHDTKEYLSTIGMTFVIKYPDFVHKLRSHGLSTWEVGYCCLYIMGYNAKEISGIMQNNQVYKISSEIRKKLGLEGGKVKLETYLKELFACR